MGAVVQGGHRTQYYIVDTDRRTFLQGRKTVIIPCEKLPENPSGWQVVLWCWVHEKGTWCVTQSAAKEAVRAGVYCALCGQFPKPQLVAA